MLWSFLLYIEETLFQDFTWSTPNKKQRPKEQFVIVLLFFFVFISIEREKRTKRDQISNRNSKEIGDLLMWKSGVSSWKDPLQPEILDKIVEYLCRVLVICAVESFFAKNACANFSTPYTAHPPTRSETKVTQRVGKREKRIWKKCLTLSRCEVRYSPLKTSN